MISHRKHFPSLDGLRGIAILLIFLYHTYPRPNLGGTSRISHDPLAILASCSWVGVDLFFVLSGFLITGILLDTRTSAGFFSKFYARRALRLLPVYLVVIGLLVILAPVLKLHLTWKMAGFFLYTENLSAFLYAPPNFGHSLDFDHLWSLALEEQFYMIWPVLLYFLADRRKVARTCIIGIVLATLLRIAAISMHVYVSPYRQLPTRMDTLLAGGLVAVVLRGPSITAWLNPRRLNVLLLGSLAVFLAAPLMSRTLHYESAPMVLFGYTALGLGSSALLSLALIDGSWAWKLGNLAALRFFGRYSYGLYVIHFIPQGLLAGWKLAFTENLHPAWAARVLYTLTTLLFFTTLAVGSYQGIELPILKLKNRFSYRDEKDAGLLQVDAAVLEPARTP